MATWSWEMSMIDSANHGFLMIRRQSHLTTIQYVHTVNQHIQVRNYWFEDNNRNFPVYGVTTRVFSVRSAPVYSLWNTHTHTRAKYNSPACSSQSFSKLSVKCFWLAVVYISAPLCLLGIIRSQSAISSSSHATFIFLQILGRSARRLGLPRVTFRPRSESKLTNTRILNRYQ